MASILVGINFPKQIKETRKKIQDSFKRSHEALRVRESSLLSRVDHIETEYNSKTLEINELVENLNSIISLSSNRLKSNKLSDTKDAVATVINNKIAELTTDTHSTIDFEWDSLFDNNIKQLGKIKLDNPTIIPISSPNMCTHDSTGQQQQQQQQQQRPSNFGLSPPVISGPSMFSAEPSNPNTNLFNKQTNVFSPTQKSTFTFPATGNTPQTPSVPFAFAGTPQANQQNTPTTPQTPTYPNFKLVNDLSKRVIQTPIRHFSFTGSKTTKQQNESSPVFNQRDKTIPSNFQFNTVSMMGTVPQIKTTEPTKCTNPIKHIPSTNSITRSEQNIPNISQTASNIKPVSYNIRQEMYKPLYPAK